VIVAFPDREREAATRLGRIGFDAVAGYLDGGMQALAGAPELVRTFDRLSPAVVAEELAGAEPPLLVDVRNPGEHQADRIEGGLNIPLGHLLERSRSFRASGGSSRTARADTARPSP